MPLRLRTYLLPSLFGLLLPLSAAAQPGPPGPPGPRGGGPQRGNSGPKPGPSPAKQVEGLVRVAVDGMSAAAEQSAQRSLSGKAADSETTKSSTTDLVQIWHAPIPSDPKRLLQRVADQVPGDLDLDEVLKEHKKSILVAMRAGLSRIVFVAKQDLTYKSKRIPQGVHSLALRFKGSRLSGAVLSGEALSKSISLELVSRKLKKRAEFLSVRAVVDKKEAKRGIHSVRLVAAFGRYSGSSKYTLRPASSGSSGSDNSSDSNSGKRVGPPIRPPGPR